MKKIGLAVLDKRTFFKENDPDLEREINLFIKSYAAMKKTAVFLGTFNDRSKIPEEREEITVLVPKIIGRRRQLDFDNFLEKGGKK